MASISKDDFLKCLKQSGVVSEEKLLQWQTVNSFENANELAAKLVRDQLLTKWQAKYLMAGRSLLTIGNYRLLERIARDELGDRFLALHISLDRKVDLQVLPSNLTKDKSRCDRFIQKVTSTSNLDHPNLTHVYDIDQEKGRYFLVTEHIAGTTLDQVPRTTLSEVDASKIIYQALLGLQFAHQNKVLHGCLRPSDLLLTPDGELKVQNLSVSPLRQAEQGTATSSQTDDVKAIGTIALSLLHEIPTDKRSDNHAALLAFLQPLAEGETDGLQTVSSSLEGWLTEHGATLPDSGEDSNDGLPISEAIASLAELEATGGFDQPVASQLQPSRLRNKKQKPAAPAQKTETAEPGYFGKLWRDNPVALIATAGVLAVLTAGAGAYAIYSLGGGDPPVANKETLKKSPSASEPTTRKKVPAETKSEQAAGDLDPDKLQAEIDKMLPAAETPKAASDEAISASEPDPAEPSPSNPPAAANNTTQLATNDSANQSETAAADAPNQPVDGDPIVAASTEDEQANMQTPANSEASELATDDPISANQETASNPPAANVPTPPQPLDEISGIGAGTRQAFYSGGITTFQQIATMNAAQIKEFLSTRMNRRLTDAEVIGWIDQAKKKAIEYGVSPESLNTAASMAGTSNMGTGQDAVMAGDVAPVQNPDGPFANFPTRVQLPDSSNPAEVKLADLVIKAQYLLAMELIAEPGFSKARAIFEIERTPEDKQKWSVSVKRRAKETGTPIAFFRKSPEALHFQWLPEAAENKLADYLRNCFIKLNLPDGQSRFLVLREPIKIPDLRISENALLNRQEIEIPWLPDPSVINVEVLPLRVQGTETNVIKSDVKPGSPAEIWLKRDDQRGFMSLQVFADMRSKLKLQSNLVHGRLPNRVVPISSTDEFNALLAQTNQAVLAANQLYESNRYIEAPYGKKTEFREYVESLEKAAREASERQQDLMQYAETIKQLMNKPILVRIYAKLGKISVELATSDPALADSDAVSE